MINSESCSSIYYAYDKINFQVSNINQFFETLLFGLENFTMGTLYIVATPIGNREDITIRALKILFSAPVIACEDTRRTGLLLQFYRDEILGNNPKIFLSFSRKRESLGIPDRVGDDMITTKPKLVSFYDEIEEQKIPEIIELLQSGKDVALVSDAGTPLISDPGFKLVRECHRQNIPVSPIPGPSSITAALSVSGLPTDRFMFIGYLPKKKGKREKVLNMIKLLRHPEERSDEGSHTHHGTQRNEILRLPSVPQNDILIKTFVLLETPHHINQTLEELHKILPESTVCISNELTKYYEKIIVASLPYSIKQPKGEYVIIFS